MERFPRLQLRRHHHGLTTFGLVPHAFAGWSNGARSEVEGLDWCGEAAASPGWVGTGELLVKREKFAHVRVPSYFVGKDCGNDGP